MGIVLEYLDGGDLSELVDRRWADGGAGISEPDARRLFQQLMVAVDYCHGMGIANRGHQGVERVISTNVFRLLYLPLLPTALRVWAVVIADVVHVFASGSHP